MEWYALWLLVDLVFYPVVIIGYLLWFKKVVDTRFAIMRKKKKGYIIARIYRKNRVVETFVVKPDKEGNFTVKVGKDTENHTLDDAKKVYYDPMFDAWVAVFTEGDVNAKDPLQDSTSPEDSAFQELMVLKAYELGRAESKDFIQKMEKLVTYLLVGIIIVAVVSLAAAYFGYQTMDLVRTMHATAPVAKQVVENNVAQVV